MLEPKLQPCLNALAAAIGEPEAPNWGSLTLMKQNGYISPPPARSHIDRIIDMSDTNLRSYEDCTVTLDPSLDWSIIPSPLRKRRCLRLLRTRTAYLLSSPQPAADAATRSAPRRMPLNC